jgi:hypothetical protein
MEFRSRLEWAQTLVQETHSQRQHLISLRTTGRVNPHDLAYMIEQATEVHQWARAVLTEVQAAQLAADNRALKDQIKRLRHRLRHGAAA